jgi:hypothetical protein
MAPFTFRNIRPIAMAAALGPRSSTWFFGTEGVGFEPTDPCGSPVFKTGAINHSTTPPGGARWGAAYFPMPGRRSSWLAIPLLPPGRVARERAPLQEAR